LVYNALELTCWDAWESLGAVEVARTIRIRSSIIGSAVCLGLMFVAVYSRSMYPFSYYSLIPSRLCPLKGDPLISSYLGSTWESLGLQVTSSVPSVSLLSPFLSVLSLQSKKLSLDLSLFSCVLLCAAPLSTVRRPRSPSILSPSVFARTLGRSPSLQERSRSPHCLKLNHACNSRCTPT